MKPELRAALVSVGLVKRFSETEVIRHKGSFAPDMLLLLEGEALVELADSEFDDASISVGRDSIVGEIGFLTGKGANASVRALSDVEAVSLDQRAMEQFEEKHPDLAVIFYRYLARTMDARQIQNEVLLSDFDHLPMPSVEVVRCKCADTLLQAQKLRYAVYCGEFGRDSPNADQELGAIVDELDQHGISFLALRKQAPVGTVRINFVKDGGLGILPQLYGMAGSGFCLDRSVVVTKFAIVGGYRGGGTYLRLFSAIGSYIAASGYQSIFMDCVPKYARFYKSIGFEQCAEEFIHYENGLSVPMVLDIEAYLGEMSFSERYSQNVFRHETDT
ncbi:MAG: cyclic nucleotide-binding domain-containing protein [Rhizobiaceae bacterium]